MTRNRTLRNMLLALAVLALSAACGAQTTQAPVAPESEDHQVLYAIGYRLAGGIVQTVDPFGLDDANRAFVLRGIEDALFGRDPTVDMKAVEPRIPEVVGRLEAATAELERAAGAEFVTQAAAEPGAQRTGSGAVVKMLEEGSGASPEPRDTVVVHYHGTLRDGKVFDSSRERGEPARIPLRGVIRCWTEAIPLLKVGGKARITCPEDMAYGDKGAPPHIRPGATLVFEVELLEVIEAPEL